MIGGEPLSDDPERLRYLRRRSDLATGPKAFWADVRYLTAVVTHNLTNSFGRGNEEHTRSMEPGIADSLAVSEQDIALGGAAQIIEAPPDQQEEQSQQ